MKIVKIPITEQNKKVYWSKNKNSKAWEKLVSECPSMTSEEFWNNELEEYNKGETYWYFIIGKPESIIDELINLEIGDTNVDYPYIRENRPWEVDKMDWYDLYECECDALFDINGRGNTERLVVRNPKLRNLLEDGEYIPSLGQLNLMAHYMDELNKAFAYVSASPLSSAWYWSSTEYSQGSAWFVSFSNGITSYNYKYNSGRVRTVIDF